MLKAIFNRIKTAHQLSKKAKEYARISAEKKSWIKASATIDEHTTIEEHVRLETGDYCGSSIGRGTFSAAFALPNCTIGRYCSISSGVSVVAATHPMSFVSSWPGFYKTIISEIPHLNDEVPFMEFLALPTGKYLEIGNDVWIGQNVLIKGGIRIGDGAIVGMGSVVTKDVPPYAIVAGTPAKLIRYRFPEDERNFLLSIKWWKWSEAKIAKLAKFFDSPANLRHALESEEQQ